MGKELKEKYERVCAIKDRAISLIESQLNGNIENVDAKELGEVVDIAKDMAEIMKLSEEACYYHKISEAMDESSKEDKEHYMDKYLPETQMYYTPIGSYARMRDSRGRYMYTEPYYRMSPEMDDRYDESYRDRMYYSSMNGGSGNSSGSSGNSGRGGSNGSSNGSNSNYARGGRRGYDDMRDPREGKAYMARRGYMEAKEMGEGKETMVDTAKTFMKNLNEDILEMMEDASPEVKNAVKTGLAQLASKM